MSLFQNHLFKKIQSVHSWTICWIDPVIITFMPNQCCYKDTPMKHLIGTDYYLSIEYEVHAYVWKQWKHIQRERERERERGIEIYLYNFFKRNIIKLKYNLRVVFISGIKDPYHVIKIMRRKWDCTYELYNS